MSYPVPGAAMISALTLDGRTERRNTSLKKIVVQKNSKFIYLSEDIKFWAREAEKLP